MDSKARCRLHSGALCTGPKTAEGWARIAEANRRRVEVKRATQAAPFRLLDEPGQSVLEMVGFLAQSGCRFWPVFVPRGWRASEGHQGAL